MADITREVGDVSPKNYIKPGVQRPSPLSLVAELGEQAVGLDVALAKDRLAKEAEDLRTRYMVGAPPAIAVQEGAAETAPQLSPEDKQQVDAVGAELQKKSAAVAQGQITYNRYRLEGERLLRMAIAKRPGLAEEFRSVASQHLGVDVVGAAVEILADAERSMGKKDKEGGPDYNRERDWLVKIGLVGIAGSGTDEQVHAAFLQNIDAVDELGVQEARKSIVQTAADTQDAGNLLRRPGATAAFVSQVKDAKLGIYKTMAGAYEVFKSGDPKFMSNLPGVLANAQAQISGTVSSLRAAMAQGDVNPEIGEKEIAGLEELSRQMSDLAGGKMQADTLNNYLTGSQLYRQYLLMDNDAVATMNAAIKIFSPEILNQFVQTGGAFNKTAVLALGETLNNSGRPLTRASNAGTTASSVISSVLDRADKSNPEAIPAMAQTLVNAGTSFVELPSKEFRSDYLTGPNGYITVLEFHKESLNKELTPEMKQELLGSVSLAALSNYYALAVNIGSKFPHLKDKLDFNLDPATGDMVRPKPGVTLSGAERTALRDYNAAFAGKTVLSLFQTLTGGDARQARNLLFSGNAEYKRIKAQQTAPAPTVNTGAGKEKASGGGGNWWENF